MDPAEILTRGGEISLYHNFLWGKCIYRWDSVTRFMQMRKIHDPTLSAACKAYLVSIGASFDTMEQLREWAIKHSWPVAVESLPDMTK